MRRSLALFRSSKLIYHTVPVIQAGMQWVGYAELASAVSNAGGLGILTGLTQPTPEDLRKEIRRCRTMTDKPFGVNLTLLPSIVPPDYGAYAQVIIDEGVKIGKCPMEYICYVLNKIQTAISKQSKQQATAPVKSSNNSKLPTQ